MGLGGISIWQLLIILIYLLAVVTPFWKIFKKAGYSPWLSLLILVPLVNLVMIYFLAFASWPALRKEAGEA
jgi:hypothetical protein